MQLSSRTYDADNISAVQELYHSNGWTDGLPIVPPTADAVQACLDWAMMPPDQLIGIEPVRGLAVTAEKLAINAVMAGCLPMHFPVVLTAWTAMMQDDFLMHGATASTGGCAVLVVLNGPIRLELGASGTFNALGNSDRATAVIGRAIRLCLINLMDVRPGAIDRSTLGHPGKFSYCVAEDEEDTTWLSLAEQRGIPKEASAVTVMAAGAPRQIMNEWTTKPEEILETFAAEMRANLRHYSIHPGNYALIIPKQLREHLQAAKLEQDRHRQLHPRARPHPSPRMGRRRQGRCRARPRRQRLSGDGIAGPAPGHRRRRTGRRLRRDHPAVARQQEPCRHHGRSAPASTASRRRSSRGRP